MRLSRKTIIPIAIISMCLFCIGISSASVVTIDVPGKTAKSSDKTLDAFDVQVSGQQAGICINNLAAEPQIFILRVNGLTDQSYDLYVNGTFKASKPANQLQQGVEVRVDGSITDPGMMRCLNAINPKLQETYDLLKTSHDPECQTACDTLNQAVQWCQLALQKEHAWRSVRVIVGPAGKALDSMEWMERSSDYDTADSVTKTCWLLQLARGRMYDQIQNVDLRDQTVAALTPVAFSASYSTKNGKSHVAAKLLNNCDLPINGTISLGLPKGWKSTAKKLNFDPLKSGQTFGLSFDLIAPSKKAVAPDSMSLAANMTIVRDDAVAKLKLKVTAKANSK